MLGALAALLPAGAAAQQSDARQRTTETIVADGLAQLPAADAKVFNQVMGELAATGSKGVEMIAPCSSLPTRARTPRSNTPLTAWWPM